MKIFMKQMLTSACAIALASNGMTGVLAQDKNKAASAEFGLDVVIDDPLNAQWSAGGQESVRATRIFSMDGDFGGRVIKGAPFSAETLSETTQTLGNGDQIVQRTEGRMARDSEGRTRREHSFQLAGSDERKTSISIDDPTANVHIALDSENRVAHKLKTPTELKVASAQGVAGVAEGKGVRVMTRSFAGAPAGAISQGITVHGFAAHPDGVNAPVTESLGKQTIEGVECDGTKSVSTIPAGTIGNERAIVTVIETWYSPELKMTIQSKHTDPRFGETSYRMTNINRAEPEASLFQIPSDYTVREDIGPSFMMAEPAKTLESKKP